MPNFGVTKLENKFFDTEDPVRYFEILGTLLLLYLDEKNQDHWAKSLKAQYQNYISGDSVDDCGKLTKDQALFLLIFCDLRLVLVLH